MKKFYPAVLGGSQKVVLPKLSFLSKKGYYLASLEDVATMKFIAISHRPVKRDYIDIFFLLRIFNLAQIFSLVSRKYPNFNQYLALRALTYFEDIKDKEEKRLVKMLESGFSWEGAKKTIFEAVKKYQLGLLKK